MGTLALEVLNDSSASPEGKKIGWESVQQGCPKGQPGEGPMLEDSPPPSG
jgi:hypothetical protein